MQIGDGISIFPPVSVSRPLAGSKRNTKTSFERWFAASRNRPPGAIRKLRGQSPPVKTRSTSVSFPDPPSIENTARLFWPRFEFEAGIIGFYCGRGPFHVRFLPPVGVMEPRHFDDVFTILAAALAQAAEDD